MLPILPPVAAGSDARMRVQNADGSDSEMCGNGLRCVVKYLYERGGVAEYWIVDPEAETVKVLRRAEGEAGTSRFARPLLLTLHEGDALATPLLPGVQVPLAAVFED